MGIFLCRDVGKGGQGWDSAGREDHTDFCHIFISLRITALVGKASPSPGLLAGAW